MSKGVRLRDVETRDLAVLIQHQLEVETINLAVMNPRTAEALDAHWRKILSNPGVIAKVIMVDDTVVGAISCFRAEGQDEVGYWIARDHWGKGIATRALRLLLEQVTTRPLHATVARANAASLRVLQRCGFTLTGYHLAPASERYPACEVATFILS